MRFKIPSISWLSNASVYEVNRIKPHSDHKYYLTDRKLCKVFLFK